MGEIKADLKPDEKAALKLRGLYEQFGYKKYRMGRFEEYSLYAENKDFLAGDKVIAFTDLDGRLMALKPDVTLSIIKNTKATRQNSEKLYYIENVYRESKESHTFKEINQLGLELLGDVDLYGVVEVVALAAQTLRTISPDYILELSHMSFVLELLRSMNLSEHEGRRIIKHIRNKNADGIRRAGEEAGLLEEQIRTLCRIPLLYGEVPKTVKEAAKLVVSDEMQRALDELDTVYRALKANGSARGVQVDFSIVNDIDYYNGIIFRGYIKTLARSVLAGGQYDSAMRIFGKDVGAMGFALYLNELSMLTTSQEKPDVDALVLYHAGAEPSKLAHAVLGLQKEGLRVRAEKAVPQGVRYLKLFRFDGEKLTEEAGTC